MFTDKLLLTKNYKDIERAKELGISDPEPEQYTAEFLFHKEDVKNAVLDGDKILIDFYDEQTYSFKYDKKMWTELKKFFIYLSCKPPRH